MSFDVYPDEEMFMQSRALRERHIAEQMSFVLYPNADPTAEFSPGKLFSRTIGDAVSEAQFKEDKVPKELLGMTRLGGSADLMAREHHIAGILNSVRREIGSNICSGFGVRGIERVAGTPFDEASRYRAFGYGWYSLGIFTIGEGRLAHLRPWMHPVYQGGSPMPRLYTDGTPDSEQIERIAFKLFAS